MYERRCRENNGSEAPKNHQVMDDTAQKMRFSIKDFLSKLRIWSHLIRKSSMENFIFWALEEKFDQREKENEGMGNESETD